MFDSLSLHQHESPSHVTHKYDVTVNRAPTDESVKLLMEMEKAAEKKLLASCQLNDNQFSASWVIFSEPWRLGKRCVCRYKLNGSEREFEISLPEEFIISRTGVQQLAIKIRDEITQRMAEDMTVDLFKKAKVLIH